MPYFESDTRVLEWFERALVHHTPHVRRQALALLEQVASVRRDEWLRRAQRDADPTVAAEAVLISALVRAHTVADTDLQESDLATGLDAEDLQWEWEYELVVADGFSVPAGVTLAWTKEEDDVTAREIALMKCYVGKENEQTQGTPIIVSKRLVTRYTRSARSFAEAMRWHHEGRPRYPNG